MALARNARGQASERRSVCSWTMRARRGRPRALPRALALTLTAAACGGSSVSMPRLDGPLRDASAASDGPAMDATTPRDAAAAWDPAHPARCGQAPYTWRPAAEVGAVLEHVPKQGVTADDVRSLAS